MNELDFPVVKEIKLDEIIEVDGGFFRIEKQTITPKRKKECTRYFLITVQSPKKMKLLKDSLQLTAKESGKE